MIRAILIFKIIFMCVAITGWVKNVIKFAECDFEPSYKAEIVHGIGIVTPISIVTGYLDLGE